MWLDLSCVKIESKTKSLLDKRVRYFSPVEVRICKVMSVVVAHSSVELAIDLSVFKKGNLVCETIGKVGILLSKCSGRSRLAVSMS